MPANEPNLMTLWFRPGSRSGEESFLPWDAALPRRFRTDHGYDLLPLLPALFTGDSDAARWVRRHFFQTVGAIFSDNSTGRIARWAEAHRIRSGGHLLLEERLDIHVIGRDYSRLDGAAILAGRLRHGRLVVGRHEDTSIIMPQVGLLPLPVMRGLPEFRQAVGQPNIVRAMGVEVFERQPSDWNSYLGSKPLPRAFR